MKRSIIRWPGLAAFAAIVGLLVIVSWLFLDAILKVTLEYGLGRLNGAEVTIQKVEHKWSPLTLTAYDVQATDPAKPSHNQVQLEKFSADVSAAELLLGRIHIEQLDVVGVRVDQARKQGEGEVYVAPSKEDIKEWASGSWEQLKVSLPSTDEIVQQVGLQTEQILTDAETQIEQQREQFEQAKAALPTKETLQQYQQQVKAITEGKVEGLGDIAARKEKLDNVKAAIRQDKEAIQKFRQQLSESADVVKTQIARVKEAPENDINRIRNFFQLNESGLQNVTGLLLGDKARQWSEYLLLAYEQLAPMLARSANTETVEKVRGEGESLSFVEDDAPPEFWIKQARTEVMIGDTAVNIDWQNITHQHDLLGQPTTYQARVDNGDLWQAFNLDGELSLLSSGIDAKQQWQLKGANVKNLGLSDSSELTAAITSALIDSDGRVLVRGNQLDGEAIIRMLDLAVTAQGSSKITNAIAQALAQLKRLDINTKVGGDILNPKLNLNSDLDQQLGKLLSQTAMAEAQTKLDDIKSELSAKVENQLGPKNQLLEDITQLNGQAESFDQQLEELLKAKIEDSLKDKLKDRLFGS
ncbi:TIGR03545 family protein [Idiomarina sp. OT37-5b]|uniref:TIGR03545 family protein n=1 Tax=Idiomarina sp. OT37-5b TaxID=2100422 RepID=UPI000CF8631F|nr:TIGR03545 family protein [Idiomarina sp. OT37-5b]AVJ56798.1 TIGR03545 family protein [Idiomarina sp. OT37-5b]